MSRLNTSVYTPSRSAGFSLIELLLAMTITVGVSAVAFQLFHQNSRVFHDQDSVIDAQQMARATVSEIADEIRMAGQEVPVFSATYDRSPSEGVSVVMAGSGRSRINVRSGRSNVEAVVTAPASPRLNVGTAMTLTITDAALFSNVIGSSPTGRFSFVWGPVNTEWGWARAVITAITARTNSIQLTPVELAGGGASIQFTGAPTISLEEAVAIYRDTASRSIRRTTATDMTDPAAPGWAPANELAVNVSDFSLRYYGRDGAALEPDTPEHRAAIARIDFEAAIEVENTLSNGLKPVYRFSSQGVPRNLRIP